MELKCSTKNRERLDTVFREVVGARRTVRHLIPRIAVEIADLDPTIEAEDVQVAVRSYFDQGLELELRVSLSKTPYRGNRNDHIPGIMCCAAFREAVSNRKQKKKQGGEANIAQRWPPP